MTKITHTDFEPCIGQRFIITLDDSTAVVLELVSVQATSGSTPGATRQPFSSVFRGPQQPLLQQQIYRLTNETLGELALFLVPIGPESNTMLYEVVFN